MADIMLNDGQYKTVQDFCYWYKHPLSRKRPWYEISGAAGTGKTTTVLYAIRMLGLELEDVLFVAFVGKAALQLRLSGVPGRTFHSVMYRIEKHLKRENGIPVYENGVPVYVEEFVKVSSLPANVKLIVLDEAGMVAKNNGLDILSFDIPLLCLGDLHQLPPVFGQGLFLLTPDSILTEIMRQKKDSPIIYLSQLAMHGISIPYGEYGKNKECIVIHRSELTDEHLKKADLIICATNTTRDKINWYVRRNIYNIESPNIEIGEKLICRENYWDISLGGKYSDIALVNGMIGYVTDVTKETHSKSINMQIDFKPEFSDGTQFKKLPVNRKYILNGYAERQSMHSRYDPNIIFELGYCSTCHLAQGSQYDWVLIYNEVFSVSDYQKRWLYTAITRAKKGVILVN